jgi:hypothetical protein
MKKQEKMRCNKGPWMIIVLVLSLSLSLHTAIRYYYLLTISISDRAPAGVWGEEGGWFSHDVMLQLYHSKYKYIK